MQNAMVPYFSQKGGIKSTFRLLGISCAVD